MLKGNNLLLWWLLKWLRDINIAIKYGDCKWLADFFIAIFGIS